MVFNNKLHCVQDSCSWDYCGASDNSCSCVETGVLHERGAVLMGRYPPLCTPQEMLPMTRSRKLAYWVEAALRSKMPSLMSLSLHAQGDGPGPRQIRKNRTPGMQA